MSLYLIRHGQSEFNAAYTGAGDPMIYDAPLTQLGRTQAHGLQDIVAPLNIDHVICSPLTRAIQTARLGFPDHLPELWPLARERQDHSCDVGSPPATLAQSFPDLDLSHLSDLWWHDGPANEHGIAVEPEPAFKARMDTLRAALISAPHTRLALVCHGYVIEALTGTDPDNCQIVQLPRS